jgi:peptidoglycan/LPS O-acetylase OafA/YrhL
MSVFLFHARGIGVSLISPLANHGNLGVPVFFALSGYLVYRPFLSRQVEPVRYLLRRTMRMAPAWLVAVIGVRLAIPGEGGFLVLVMWSLFVEMTFYAVLPLLAQLARGREVALVGGLGLASYLANFALPNISVPIVAMPALLPIFFWSFALGMLLAIVERDHPRVIEGHAWLAGGLALTVIGYLIADTYPAAYNDPIASMLIVLGAVGVMGGLMGWQQRWAWAALGAEATYSFYLWHDPILNALASVMPPPRDHRRRLRSCLPGLDSDHGCTRAADPQATCQPEWRSI